MSLLGRLNKVIHRYCYCVFESRGAVLGWWCGPFTKKEFHTSFYSIPAPLKHYADPCNPYSILFRANSIVPHSFDSTSSPQAFIPPLTPLVLLLLSSASADGAGEETGLENQGTLTLRSHHSCKVLGSVADIQ